MTSTATEIVVQNQPVVHDVEALVQAAVSVLTNDMQIATHDQNQIIQTVHEAEHGTVQLLVDTCNSNNIQERLYMCTDCNLAFYGEQGEQEWQWHLKQHKPFRCDLCSEAYEDRESLRSHVRTHSIQMPFICDKCGSAYSLKSNLTQHMKTHEDKLYQCAECEVIFKSQTNLEKHLKLHTGTINVFQCETCSKTFTQQKNLVQHMKIHQGNVGKQYKCPECPAAYNYKCHLSRHLIIHTGEKPYKCKFCGKAFNRNAHLIRHRKMHSGGEKEWKCQHCGFAFWEKGDLIRHIRSHEGNRPLKCEYCEQTFVWKRYLYKHLSNHHKADDKHFCKTCLACLPSEEDLVHHDATEHADRRPLTHSCEICNHEFHFKYKLDEHMFEHTGEKAHACQKCSLRFVSRRDLDRHALEHQQEVSFRCNTCEKSFSTIDALQLHVKLHTGNAKYICTLCHSAFRWRSQLTSHMVVHSADRDFKCGFCVRKFKRKRDLIRHVKIYHDTKPPYKCTECNQDFHSPFNLMHHKMETHWKEAENVTGRYACTHCSGIFRINSDLQRHLKKVHPPRPHACMLCMKRFTLLKFLQKHFEIKHEGIEMIEGKNYELMPEEEESVDIVIMENVSDANSDIDKLEKTDNQQYLENEITENKVFEEIATSESVIQDMITIEGGTVQNVGNGTCMYTSENDRSANPVTFSSESIGSMNPVTFTSENVASTNRVAFTTESVGSMNPVTFTSESIGSTNPVTFTSESIGSMSTTSERSVLIPEAITLAQFSQQGSDDIMPVFLQENSSLLPQPQSIAQKEVPSVAQISSLASAYKNIVQVLQPQTVSIPQPQVVRIQQPPRQNMVAANTVNVSTALRNKSLMANPVKIPIINKSPNRSILVQQGTGPNKQIKIISMPSQLTQLQPAVAQSVPLRQIGTLPVVSLSDLEGQVVSCLATTQSGQMVMQSESIDMNDQMS